MILNSEYESKSFIIDEFINTLPMFVSNMDRDGKSKVNAKVNVGDVKVNFVSQIIIKMCSLNSVGSTWISNEGYVNGNKMEKVIKEYSESQSNFCMLARFFMVSLISRCYPRGLDSKKKKQSKIEKSVENIEYESIIELLIYDLTKLHSNPEYVATIVILSELTTAMNNAIIYQTTDDKLKAFLVGKLGQVCANFQKAIALCKHDPSPLATSKFIFDKKTFEDATDQQVECVCRTGRNGIAT